MILLYCILFVVYQFIYSKPKTQKGKRFLEKREPKIFENTKSAIFVKGGNTSITVTQAMKELVC